MPVNDLQAKRSFAGGTGLPRFEDLETADVDLPVEPQVDQFADENGD